MYKKLPVHSRKPSSWNPLPWILVICSTISIFLVYNASSIYAYNTFNNSYYFLINQTIWFSAAIFLFYVIQKLPISLFEKSVTPLFFICVFLLLLVLMPLPFSVNVYGARRWLVLNPEGLLPEVPFLGRLTLQPSELFKLAISLFLPKLLLQNIKYGESHIFVKSLVYLSIPSLLILLEPDLKDTLIVAAMGISILFVSNISLKYFTPAIPIAIAAALLLIIIAPYRFERLKTYLGGGSDLGTSYHVKQINIALGSGGLFGVGVGKSIQKNEYLPEVMGDSIFAVFAEEFGFVGSLSLILLLLFLLYTLYKMVNSIQNVYYKLYSIGVLVWISIQSIMNLGSISGILPLTGVPLPLISYGGSSLIFTVIALGLVNRFYNNDKV